jgi:hypothetical protein
MAEPNTARVVKIGKHAFSCLSAHDYMKVGELRWHSLHARTQEMLEAARAEPAHRVTALQEVYAQRDRTTALAVQHAATLEGAFEVIEMAAKVAKVDLSSDLASMTPEQVIAAALGLVGVDLTSTKDNDSGNG